MTLIYFVMIVFFVFFFGGGLLFAPDRVLSMGEIELNYAITRN